MISYKHRFLYIHIPKTAGKSLKDVIQKEFQEATYLLHMDMQQSLDWLGPEEFERLFKFSWVRNPWAMWVSMFFFFKKEGIFYNHVEPEGLSFPEWLVKQMDLNKRDYFSWLELEDGSFPADFIGRVESMEHDCRRLFTLLGFKNPNVRIPRINKTDHAEYTTYYTPETIKLVEERHARDIEFFGYKYGA